MADLKLAVSEAVTNSIVHAFRSTDAGTFTVAIDVRPTRASPSVSPTKEMASRRETTVRGQALDSG